MDERGGLAMARFRRSLLLVVAVVSAGCAAASSTEKTDKPPGLVLAYDNGTASGTMAFPSTAYESVIRFQLPPGMHHPRRIKLQAGAEGAVEVTVYEDSPLEMPGQPLYRFTRAVAKTDVSNGSDARWVIQEIQGDQRISGAVWIGLRKADGTPTIWTSSTRSDQAYMRDTDPGRAMGLIPARRTPMIRLELEP